MAQSPIGSITANHGETIEIYPEANGRHTVRLVFTLRCSLPHERDGGARPHAIYLDPMQSEMLETALRVTRKGGK